MGDQGDGCIDIYIAVYKPSQGVYYHWVLALRISSSSKSGAWQLFEAIRKTSTSFAIMRRMVDPSRSHHCHGLHHVVSLRNVCLSDVLELVKAVKVPHHDAQWNCQDYVVDICDALVQNGFVNELHYLTTTWPGVNPFHGRQVVDFRNLGSKRDQDHIVSKESVQNTDPG